MQIRHKVFLTVFLTVALIVSGLLVNQRSALRDGFLNYTTLVASERLSPLRDELAREYAEANGWSFIAGETRWPIRYIRVFMPIPSERDAPAIAAEFERMRSLPPGFLAPPPPRHTGRGPPRNPMDTLSLVDQNGDWVAGAPASNRVVTIDIVVSGDVVGQLALTVPIRIENELELAFFNQQVRVVWMTGLFALFLAAVAAVWLSRSFAQPIQSLVTGVTQLTRGRYSTRVDHHRNDELGHLATNVNALAETLERTRASQRAWIADTSHELRTPVTILQAELEALQDGVRPTNSAAIESLLSELQKLSRLIDDLHQLAAADSGQLAITRQTIDLSETLEASCATFQKRFEAKSIAMKLSFEALNDNAPMLWALADEDRIRQVFDNLLQNALRYTDPGGELQITGRQDGDQICIRFEDTKPGVPEASVVRLFDRFYRVDVSRNRRTGSAGLGLSICESIITGHGGSISAAPSPLGGLAVNLVLPAGENHE